MRFSLLIPATLTALLMGCTAGQSDMMSAQTAGSEGYYLSKIDELMPGMGAEKIVDRKDSQMAFERICLESGAPGNETHRAALCKAMMKRVGPEVAMPARVWLLRKVETIGREEVVPRLAELTRDKNEQIRELARRALTNNPAPEAGAVLRDELKNTTCVCRREKMINSLAFRHDATAVELIAGHIHDEPTAVAKAAILALGEIGTEPAVNILMAELEKSDPQAGSPIVEACLDGAERLAANGNTRKAADAYGLIYKLAKAESTRMAALWGLCTTDGANAVLVLIREMSGQNQRMQIVAADYAGRVPGEAATKQLADAVATAKPELQAILLDILGVRGDKTAGSTVEQYVNANDAAVRIAAIKALCAVGNSAMVEMLAELASGTTGAVREAARDSLGGMNGEDVDKAIVQAIPVAKDRVKAELIRAASVRLTKPVFNDMLAYANDADETIATSVIEGIGKIAKPTDLPAVLKVLSGVSGDKALEAAKGALVQICTRAGGGDERAQPLIQAMTSADTAVQEIAVKALASLKGDVALAAVRAALKSDREAVRQAAAKSLADWGPLRCMSWVFAGPFRKEGAKAADLLDIAFPPEDAKAQVEWKKLKKVKGTEISLDQIDKGQNCCAYIRTKIESKTDQDVVLTFGSDDGIKVWLNGKEVHAKNLSRTLKVDEDEVPASLKSGENTLLIKVTQNDKDWMVSCGVKSSEGGPPLGVSCDAE